MPIAHLAKAENINAHLDFVSKCKNEAMAQIHPQSGKLLKNAGASLTIDSAITHAILTELRRQNVTI